MEEVQFAGAVSTSDPYNYRQAIQADDSERWKEATLAEYNTLLQNGTWEIVDLHQVKRQLAQAGCFGLNTIPTALLNATRPESSPKAALNVLDETISKCTRLLRVLQRYGRLLL